MNLLKNYISKGENLIILGVLAFAFEWWFVRDLESHGYTAMDIVFSRIFFSLILWIAIYYFKPKTSEPKSIFSKKEIFYMFCIGLTAVMTNWLFNKSVVTTTVSNSLILFYTSVFWGSILGFLFFKEKLTKRSVYFTIIGFIGIVLSVLNFNKISQSFGIGEMFAILASLSFSFEIIIAKGLKDTNFYQRMIGMYIFASVISFCFIVYSNGLNYFMNMMADINYIIPSILFALTCGVMGKGLTYLGVAKVAVNTVMVILLAEPIMQIITAYFVADEVISKLNIAGMIIVFVAIFKMQKK